ncbi:MAG: hypothetical protein ACLFQU_11845 [Candidatus Kapaibacterium sp.]
MIYTSSIVIRDICELGNSLYGSTDFLPNGLQNPWRNIYQPGNDLMFDMVGWGAIGKSILTGALRGVGTRGVLKESFKITNLTRAGKYPSWSTVKTRYWELIHAGKVPTGRALVRIRTTGEVRAINVSKELHHINGRTGVDPHRFNNLQEVWPWEHEAIDPSRHIGYDFIRWVE